MPPVSTAMIDNFANTMKAHLALEGHLTVKLINYNQCESDFTVQVEHSLH